MYKTHMKYSSFELTTYNLWHGLYVLLQTDGVKLEGVKSFKTHKNPWKSFVNAFCFT